MVELGELEGDGLGMQGASLAPQTQQKAGGLQPDLPALPVTGCARKESRLRNPKNRARSPHHCLPVLPDPYP